jgi:hypothetical protein
MGQGEQDPQKALEAQRDKELMRQAQEAQVAERMSKADSAAANAEKALAEAQRARAEVAQLVQQTQMAADSGADALLSEAMRRREMLAGAAPAMNAPAVGLPGMMAA